MRFVGLTGSLGAGKSTVAHMFAKLGAQVIDADDLARQAVAPGSACLNQIRATFGPQFIDEFGFLKRKELGQLIFGDSDKVARLNAIIHPEVRRLKKKALANLQKTDPQGLVIYSVPLLFETGMEKEFQRIILVSIEPEIQQKRLTTQRGFTLDEVQQRLRHQMNQAEKRARSHFIINNSGSLQETQAQIGPIWAKLKQLAPNPFC